MRFADRLFRNKLFFIVELFVLLIFPLFILSLNPSLFKLRTIIMILFLPYVFTVIKLMKISLKKLGFTKKNLMESFIDLLVPTIISIIILNIIFVFFPYLFDIQMFNKITNALSTPGSLFYLLFAYPLLSAPLQELIFRGYITSRTELVTTNKVFILFYTSFVFMLIHFPFQNMVMIVGSLFLGIIWERNFLKYGNIIPLLVSHGLIGMVYVYNIYVLIGK